MQINTTKTKVMVFFETPATKAARDPPHFTVTFKFPLNKPHRSIQLKEPDTFTYLGLQLDPVLSMHAATNHMVQMINWAHLTIAAVAHSLHHDTPLRLQHCRSSPLVLFRLWQSCVLPFALINLRYLSTSAQIDKVQTNLINSLTRTLRCYAPPQTLMIEFAIPPLRLQQAAQLIGIHFRYTITHTHLVSAHLYSLRRAKMCSSRHSPQSMENRIVAAHTLLRLSQQYPGPPPIPLSVQQAKVTNKCKTYNRYLKKFVNQEWFRQLNSAHQPHIPSPSPTSRTHAYVQNFLPAHFTNHYKLPLYITLYTASNTISILRLRTQCHELIPTHAPEYLSSRRDEYSSRLCNYCSLQETGSETHIILDCPYTQPILHIITTPISKLLSKLALPSLSQLSQQQQVAIILGNPPPDLVRERHPAWIKAALPHCIKYIFTLQQLLYSI